MVRNQDSLRVLMECVDNSGVVYVCDRDNNLVLAYFGFVHSCSNILIVQ